MYAVVRYCQIVCAEFLGPPQKQQLTINLYLLKMWKYFALFSPNELYCSN
jgi:hypothetical protein